MNKDDQKFVASFMRAYGVYGAISIQLVVSIVLGVMGGKYLDEILETEQVFLLVGALLGTVAGFWSLFRTIKSEELRKKRELEREQDS